MFKSISNKILMAYLSILILVMLILSFTISYFTDYFAHSDKERIMDNISYKTITLVNAMEDGTLSKEQLSQNIDSMGYITDTKIYIIRASAQSLTQPDLGEELKDQYLYDALQRILKGETVYLRRYSQGFEAQMLFAGYPWKKNAQIEGAILLFSPEKELAALINRINEIIWLTAAIFILLGGIVIFFVTRRITRPIKAIDAASKRISRGEEAEDIVIKTKDEIGSLAGSFNAMKQKIKINEELRQDLIANISHDLRTPLTTINGFVKGISQGIVKQEDYPRVLGIIQEETTRLMQLTEEIIETAKIQSGNLELHMSRFYIKETAQRSMISNSQFALQKNIQIKLECDKNIEVYADDKKIEHVFYNLIHNAIKYSHPAGSVRVKIIKKENEIECRVSDSGIGIKEEELPVIFERFYRADTHSAGHGLGLAIAKSYVESHHGRIWVESKWGKGTAVSFEIPIS